VKLTVLKNPEVVKETASFGIYVMDKNNKGIAFVDTDVKYMPTPGKIYGISLESKAGTKI
jgi:hypothetical protein